LVRRGIGSNRCIRFANPKAARPNSPRKDLDRSVRRLSRLTRLGAATINWGCVEGSLDG
jgi:hypothetical protein